MDTAWKRAFETHLTSRASFAPPHVLPGLSDEVLVVCAPWRYPFKSFAEEVRRMLHRPVPTVVALPPPFRHPEGGWEWWAYREDADEDDERMASLGLLADEREVEASVSAVRSFVEALPQPHVALFGSSQGGSVVAHVGVSCSKRLERAVAYQPAGVYRRLWRPHGRIVRQSVDEATHGDLSAWRGRLGRRNGTLTVFTSRRDVVAPPELLKGYV